MGFKNLTKVENISLFAPSLISFGNLFHSLWADVQKVFFPYMAVCLFDPKWTRHGSGQSQSCILLDYIALIQLCCSTQYFECVKHHVVQWSEMYLKPVELEQNWCCVVVFVDHTLICPNLYLSYFLNIDYMRIKQLYMG